MSQKKSIVWSVVVVKCIWFSLFLTQSSEKKINQTNNSRDFQVVDISEEFCDLLEQSALFLERKELPLSDKAGNLIVLKKIFKFKKKAFGEFNKLIIIDNRLKGRIISHKFPKKAKLDRQLVFSLGNIRLAYPKTFLTHLIYSNRYLKGLFENTRQN